MENLKLPRTINIVENSWEELQEKQRRTNVTLNSRKRGLQHHRDALIRGDRLGILNLLMNADKHALLEFYRLEDHLHGPWVENHWAQ